MIAPGKYIVIEGADGTGKTTQAKLLQQYLTAQGVKVIHVKEPGGSPVAEAIRSVIVDGTLPRTPMTNLLLFTANRHELWHDVIQPALTAGTWVIATRNYWSSLAYQGYGEGMNLDIIAATTSTFTATQYMSPDIGIILTLNNITTRQQRVAARGELTRPDTFESKDDAFQHRVQDGYLYVAKQYNLPMIDASKSVDAVNEEIMRHILHCIVLPRLKTN